MDKKLLLILNPKAGLKRANRFLADIVGVFEDAGYLCTVCVTRKKGDGREFVLQYGAGMDRIVAVGGDGTLNEVIDGTLRAGISVTLGYIPAGSTNDFANSIGLSHDIMRAARDIVEGEPRKLDVCSFNGRNYTYVASCGAFANVSYATAQPMKNVLGHLAYILEGVKDITQIHPIHLNVETGDGETYDGDFLFAAFSNSTSIAGILEIKGDVVDMNDGLFEMLLIHAPKSMGELGSIVYSLLTQQYDAPCLTFCAMERAHVTADPSIDWTLDGEFEQGTDAIEIRNLPDAITVMTPAVR